MLLQPAVLPSLIMRLYSPSLGHSQLHSVHTEIHKRSLFDLILYIPSTIFQLNRDGSSWVEPVLS